MQAAPIQVPYIVDGGRKNESAAPQPLQVATKSFSVASKKLAGANIIPALASSWAFSSLSTEYGIIKSFLAAPLLWLLAWCLS